MCDAVRLPDGRSLYSVNDLRAVGFVVEPDDYGGDWDPDHCLCGVDVDAVVERSGVPWELMIDGSHLVERLPT